MCGPNFIVGDTDSEFHGAGRQRQSQSRQEVEAEFAAKASVALQAGQKFLLDNFERIRVSQGSRQFQVSFLLRITKKKSRTVRQS